MKSRPEVKYYLSYENRYRSVYSQGIAYWSAFPEAKARATSELERFLLHHQLVPADTRIIEFGCGEGYLAQYVVGKGHHYVGVDISPAAISKARDRLGTDPSRARFLVGDITQLSEVDSQSFDVSLDNCCWHMLVTDPDRARYLSEVARILKPAGKAWFLEGYERNASPEEIRSYEDYVDVFNPDLETLEDRDVYVEGQRKVVQLRRVPARMKNLKGYRKELVQAGFGVDRSLIVGDECILYCTNRCRTTS